MNRCIVLGRFQPFHLGHAGLVEAAIEHAKGGPVIVAIGSAQAGWEANNPWTADERQAMIEAWANEHQYEIDIVQIEDINDPPNWVAHAIQVHGEGMLVTSDGPTKALYLDAGWNVVDVQLSNREALEGWRVRQSIRMLSTVMDDDATREVLRGSVPHGVIEWLITEDAMFRCSTFETGVHAG
jgi:cytidyltransferase-like protein